MKRFVGILLIILALLSGMALSENEIPEPEGGKKFESDWVMEHTLAQIYYEEEGFRVWITSENPEEQTRTEWAYNCYYVPENDSLESVTSSRNDYIIDPDTGDSLDWTIAYDEFDEDGTYTVFTIDTDGHLVWHDPHIHTGNGTVLNNIGRFEGVWRNEAEEVEAEFLWNMPEDDSGYYTVWIQRGLTGADTYAVFLMTGDYDANSGKLYASGSCTVFTKNADGSYTSSDDGESYDAFFSRTEDGRLYYETANGIIMEYDIMGR